MNITDLIRNAQSGAAIDNLARQFELPPSKVKDLLAQIGPELSYNIEKNTLSRGGVADLLEMIGSGRYDAFASDADTLTNTGSRELGNQVLGQILGSKSKSRALAARSSTATGISATLIKAMLPYIASIAMGGLAKSMHGGLGDLLKRLPQLGSKGRGGGASKSARSGSFKRRRQSSASKRNFGGSPLPLPGSGASYDGGPDARGYDSDQNKGMSGSPLPLPGGTQAGEGGNPYGDIGDVLRRGGSGGSTVWTMIRNLLGGLLGFQSKGVIGWFIKMLVLRYGWRIVKALFSLVIGRR